MFLKITYFGLHWVFVVHRFSLAPLERRWRGGGGCFSMPCRASHCGGFSCCQAQAMGAMASVVETLGS